MIRLFHGSHEAVPKPDAGLGRGRMDFGKGFYLTKREQVADDRVIDTVEDFEKGVITERQALGQLRYKAPNHQIAILSQTVIAKCLKFTGSWACGD